MEENVQQIIRSKPGQEAEREDAYFRIRGLQDVVFKLNSRVNMGRLIAEELQSQQGEGEG